MFRTVPLVVNSVTPLAVGQYREHFRMFCTAVSLGLLMGASRVDGWVPLYIEEIV